MIIIDEIGYTPISRSQANKFFTFISDTYETSSIVFTTNKEITDWAEMMGDPVLTTALLDRILHHAKCFSFRGESYRLKHPEHYLPEKTPYHKQKNLPTLFQKKLLTGLRKKLLTVY